MQILSGLESLKLLPRAAALSVGNYDGVHLGHQHIIRTMRQQVAGGQRPPGATDNPEAPASRKPEPAAIVVVTFEPHPLSVLRPDLAPPRLTPASLKREILAAAGVTHFLELEPTPEVLNVGAEQFWQRLRDEAQPAHLVEGPDFNFGRGAKGNVKLLAEWAGRSGVRFTVVEPLEVRLPGLHMVPVSSSLVRWLIAYGRVSDAEACLGRPYTLRGRVVEGYRRGSPLGFPTANLDCGEQIIPADGVYAGRAILNPLSPRERVVQPPGAGRYRAAVSIGSAPTFESARRQVEAYLLDFSGDLYGRTVDIELTGWVRDQYRFPSVEQLVERIKLDVEMVGVRV